MATLSWYGMLRAGVKYVYDDSHAWNSADGDMREMSESMESHMRTIEDWKNQWIVLKDTPESVFEILWGRKAYERIWTKLESMAARRSTIEKKLSSLTKVTKTNWKIKRKLGKMLRKGIFILMRKDYLQKLIDSCSNDLHFIEEEAKKGWRRDDPYPRNTEVEPNAVYHAGMGHLLVRLALRTKVDANALHSFCCTVKNNFKVELELDLFNHDDPPSVLGPGPRSSAAIVAAYKKEYFIWKVLSLSSLSGVTASNRLNVEQMTNKPTDRLLECSTALTQVIGGSAPKCHCSSSDKYFSVEMSGTPYGHDAESDQSLSQMLSKDNPPNVNILGDLSKFRLAFELAQACLLLLRTDWFPRICICDVQCSRCVQASTERTYRFRLRMGKSTHEASPPPTTTGPWCYATDYRWTFPTKPVRRLGLLLVEIILGCRINSITENEDHFGVVEWITKEGNDAPPEELEVVLNRVRDAGSQKCAGAIRYCLTQPFEEGPTDDEMREILAKFYHDVVEP